MKKTTLEHTIKTGKIVGKRSKDRHRIKIIDGLAAWLETSTAELLEDTRGRVKWRVTMMMMSKTNVRHFSRNCYLTHTFYDIAMGNMTTTCGFCSVLGIRRQRHDGDRHTLLH